MAFYGKYNRRRNYRRSRRRLGNRIVFGKTSAKQQAKQIATLRNRINKVYKNTKPEIKNLVGSSVSYSFSSKALSDVWFSGVVPRPAPNSGGDSGMIGNYIKPLSVQLNGTFEYYNTSQTGYHPSESSGCQMRVIVLQRKTPELYTTTYELSNFIPSPAYTGAEYTTMAVKPLQTGITENWNVLVDKRFILTSDSNQKMFRIRFKPRPFRFDKDNSDIFNYCKIIIIASGLHYDQDFTEYVECTHMTKMSYTDA